MIGDLTAAQVQQLDENRYCRCLELERDYVTPGLLNERGVRFLRRARFAAYLDLQALGLERRARALEVSAVLADALGEPTP